MTLFSGKGTGEMGQKIHASNKGGSGRIMNYLDKEQGLFIDRDGNKLNVFRAELLIDHNARYLDKDNPKFFSMVDAPSKAELVGVSNDKLVEFGQARMAIYAENFGRAGVERDNLVYVLRVEQNRSFEKEEVTNEPKYDEDTGEGYVVRKGLKKGEKRQLYDEVGNRVYYVGDNKPGDNRHIHYIVSSQLDLAKLKELKAQGIIPENQRRVKISPNINAKDSEKGQGVVKSGFNRVNFINAVESKYDEITGFDREYVQKFEYKRIQEHGTVYEKIANHKAREADDLRRAKKDPENIDSGGGGQGSYYSVENKLKTNPVKIKHDAEASNAKQRITEGLKERFGKDREGAVHQPSTGAGGSGRISKPVAPTLDAPDTTAIPRRVEPDQVKEELKVEKIKEEKVQEQTQILKNERKRGIRH